MKVIGEGDFTPTQAAQFTHSATGFTLRDHTPNDLLTGFSASLFESNAHPGEFTLALRGTEFPTDPRDLLSDADLATGGLARDQIVSLYRYYKQLITPAGQSVNYSSGELLTLAGIKDGSGNPLSTSVSYLALLAQTALDSGLGKLSPASKINVVGHSLGGHLTMAFVNLFPNAVAHAYTFNGAGLGGAGIELIDRLTGVQSSVAKSLVTNLVAAPNNDFTAGVGTVLGETKRVFIEKQSLAVSDHSMVVLTDALALQSLFETIDPTIRLDKVTAILEAASATPGNSLESSLAALGKLFGKAYSAGQTTRDTFYSNLYDLQTAVSSTSSGLLTVVSLTGLSRDTLVTRAQTDIAYRYALEHLNPFAITGDSGLYAQHNADGHLDAGQTSDLYLQDRAAMLTWTLRLNTQDVAPTASSGNQLFTQNGPFEQPYQFHDIATNTQIRLDRYGNMLPPEPEDYRQIIFGTDQGETLHGNAKADHLYGGGGDDVLDGGDANDHLEGGQGDDTLHGGFGNDTLLGGAGFDTYAHYANEGLDTIRDSDGQGQVKLDNATLTGGNLIQTGLWQSQDKRHLYRLEGDTLSIDNRLRIQGFHNGDLGISLGNAPAPVATMQATLTPQADVYGSGNIVGNYLETVEQWIQADTHLSTRIDGGAGNDLLLGAGLYQKANHLRIAQGVTVAIDDTINGGTGRDWINGKAGDDQLWGDADDDVLIGGNGADQIDGGSGNDLLLGQGDNRFRFLAQRPAGGINGNEYDALWSAYSGAITLQAPTLWFDDSAQTYQVDFQYPTLLGAPQGQLVRVQYGGYPYDITLGAWSNDPQDIPTDGATDILLGGTGDDILVGATGTDYLSGGDDHDWLLGYAGNDILDGGQGDDTLVAGSDHDLLSGGEGADILMGEAGDDTLEGGRGQDYLAGGAGDDTYRIAAGEAQIVGGTAEGIADESGNDTLEFGSGITTAGIKTYVYGNDLSVEYGNNEGVWIYDGYKGAIENFRFANGITLDWHRLLGISLKTNLVFKTSEAGRMGQRVFVCPSISAIAAPILRGQTIKPFAHPTRLFERLDANQSGRVGKRVLVCPPITTIAAPIPRGQTIKPFAHPTGLNGGYGADQIDAAGCRMIRPRQSKETVQSLGWMAS